VIVNAEQLTEPGAYWARVPHRTDWFLMTVSRPEHIREQDQMAGFEFMKIDKPAACFGEYRAGHACVNCLSRLECQSVTLKRHRCGKL
jgi:hypothetical protein